MNWISIERALTVIATGLHLAPSDCEKILADFLKRGVVPAIGRPPDGSKPNAFFPDADGYSSGQLSLEIAQTDHIGIQDGQIIQNGIVIKDPHVKAVALMEAIMTALGDTANAKPAPKPSARRPNAGRPIGFDWEAIEAEMSDVMNNSQSPPTTFADLHHHAIKRLKAKPGLKGHKFPACNTAQRRLFLKFKDALDEAKR